MLALLIAGDSAPGRPLHCRDSRVAMMQGQLFTQDFLLHGIHDSPPWQDLAPAEWVAFDAALRDIFAPLAEDASINEAQTEQLVVERVLRALGWADDYLPQVNLSGRRREDVPDVLLFADAAAKAGAVAEPHYERRYRHGIALLEAKRWLRPLDRGEAENSFDPGAPSSQMLRYLSRADIVSDRKVKWGVLTNGAVWRLYWQDARSRAEEFFEVDVAGLLDPRERPHDADEPAASDGLKLFLLLF